MSSTHCSSPSSCPRRSQAGSPGSARKRHGNAVNRATRFVIPSYHAGHRDLSPHGFLGIRPSRSWHARAHCSDPEARRRGPAPLCPQSHVSRSATHRDWTSRALSLQDTRLLCGRHLAGRPRVRASLRGADVGAKVRKRVPQIQTARAALDSAILIAGLEDGALHAGGLDCAPIEVNLDLAGHAAGIRRERRRAIPYSAGHLLRARNWHDRAAENSDYL